jgi:GT2 family glycosyltransferase
VAGWLLQFVFFGEEEVYQRGWELTNNTARNGCATVIPNWNGAARLANLLERLSRQTYSIDRVIVVDNGSTDESLAVAKDAGATLIELGSNTGFSHAVNRGIQAADGADWIAVVNNDVSPEADWLGQLVSNAESANAWFATGKLLDDSPEHRIEGGFDAICRGGCAWRCGNGRLDSPVWNQSREIHFAPFTAAIFRAELFERVGVLDEQFESYLEDVDFGIRCSVAGLTGVYIPQAVAYHTGSATLGRWHRDTVRKISRNQLLLIAKHYPPKWILRYGWPVFIAQGLWGFVAMRHGTAFAYLQGKLEGLRRFRNTRETAPLATGTSKATTCPRTRPPTEEACCQRSRLGPILERSENEIRELQQLSGFDLYWKLYFALT